MAGFFFEFERVSGEIATRHVSHTGAVAKETQASIEITSRKYKSVADRSSMLFFLMSDLAKIHSYYVYSLAAYTKVFYRGIDLVTSRPEPELDDEGNELPVKVVELNDEELAARCIVLTQCLFPKFSELQLRVDGVNAMPHRRDAVDKAVRESARRVREPRQFHDAVVRRRPASRPR